MTNVIVYRSCQEWQHEEKSAKKYFPCFPRKTLAKNSLIIPRFSALPFYREFEEEARDLGSRLINTAAQHEYIADMINWYQDLQGFTPTTWTELHHIPDDGTKFILKGETNSKKFQFYTHMFAETKKDAINVHGRLCEDGLIGSQNIYVREYIPLKKFMTGIGGIPISNEWRVFCYKNKILSYAYYWSSHIEDLKENNIIPDKTNVPVNFLQKIADIISKNTNFFVFDVAETEEGEWIVIEVNSGSMSGLSENDPQELYRNLHAQLQVN